MDELSVSLGEALRVVGKTFGFHGGLTAVVALVLAFPARSWVRERRLSGERLGWRRVLSHELPWACSTLLVASALTLAIAWLRARGMLVLSEGPVKILRVAGEVLLYVAAYDVYFYALHRLFHLDPWYRWIHRVHHVAVAPTVTTAFVFHPLEATVTGGFVVALLCVREFHVASLAAIGVVGAGASVVVHSGYDLLRRGKGGGGIGSWVVTPAFHHRHHELQNCHFGAFTQCMDKLFGTVDEAAPSGERCPSSSFELVGERKE